MCRVILEECERTLVDPGGDLGAPPDPQIWRPQCTILRAKQ